jgi:hypothetical protein
MRLSTEPRNEDRVTLKMKAFSYFETSVTVNQSTSRNIPEGLNVYQHCCENLSLTVYMFL